MKKNYKLFLMVCALFFGTLKVKAQWVDVGTPGFSAGAITDTSLAFSPSGEPYVAYQDAGKSSKATVMKFNGTSWVYVGMQGFSSATANNTSLAFSPSGEPYVAFCDAGSSYKVTVKKFNGTSWVNVGTQGFSAGGAVYTSLAFAPSGEPYVAYRDEGNSQKATVMKFNGTSWVNIGAPGFSDGQANFTFLTFSPSGEPYVAYQDGEYTGPNSQKATVKKFNGTSWVNVGTQGFSSGVIYNISLAFSPSGDPYVAYTDAASFLTVAVKKFNGTSWVDVGTTNFSGGQTESTSLAFSPFGEPYVAFRHGNNKAVVKKFNGSSWENVGIMGFSAGNIQYISLKFSPSGDPYLAYRDMANSYKATVMKYIGATAGVNDINDKSKFNIYPNPTSSIVNIESSTTLSEIAIMDLSGKIIENVTPKKSKTTIDLTNYENGLYLIKVSDNLRNTQSFKVIKK